MKDIGRIEDLTIRLDKAVKLQSVEIASLRSIITNDNGDILLKSGILIDDFSNLDKSDLASGFFSCAVDESERECFPSFNAYYTDLQLLPDSDIYVFNDIITKKYQEEIFLSQLEANAFLNVNPGAVNDGQGRAVSSKKNSFLVNLLLTGGSMILQSIALKTIAAYAVAAKGAGIASAGIGGALTSYAGVSTVQAAQSGNVLAVAWEAARKTGADFLDGAKAIDTIVKMVQNGLTDISQVPNLIWEGITGGFNTVLNMFSGGGAAGSTVAGIQFQGGVNTIANTLSNVFNQSFSQTISGVWNGITLMSQGIVLGTLKFAVGVANTISIALGAGPLVSAGALAAAEAWVLAQPPVLVVLAAIAIVYVAVKVVQKVWKSIKKKFCDDRMKENIRFIKKMDNGLNLYSFEYKKEYKDIAGHGSKYGYIASEVERLYPKAVTIESNGFKMVNYSLIGR